MKAEELLRGVSEVMEYTAGVKGDAQKGFMEFNKAVLTPGALDFKTKELIAVALSLASTCEWCITYHAKMAIDAGASEEEIVEASFVAVLMAGAPALMHMEILKDAIGSFKK